MKEKLQKLGNNSVGVAIKSAIVCGVLTHMFALVNVLHNYDDIAQQPSGYGTGITSGRWFLTVFGDLCQFLGGNYNLPFVNGILFIILIAISAGFLVSALKIHNKLYSALIGMLFVVFPSATSTLYFRYTAVYYGVAILLAVIAAWVLRGVKYGILISAVCTALSLGIYQAYVPLTISILVLMLIQENFQDKFTFKQIFLRGLYYCAALALGLIVYFVILKVALVLYKTELSNYQGVGNMGMLALNDIPRLMRNAVYGVIMLPFKAYCGLNNSKIIKIAYLLIAALSATMTVYILVAKIRKIGSAVMSILLFAAFLVAVGFVEIMCPDTWIYTLMVYSFLSISCLPIVLLECLPDHQNNYAKRNNSIKKVVVLIVVALIISYAYDANVSYTFTYYANRQVENYLTSMVAQVRMTEGFDANKKWAFIGNVEDSLLNSYWQYEGRYGGTEFTPWLLNRYSRYDWLQNYVGYLPPSPTEEENAWLRNLDSVQEMPVWPSYGSIKVIDEYVVIKFEN